MLLDLLLSRSQLDRAAHLRLDEAALSELLLDGSIIEILGDRFRIVGKNLARIGPERVSNDLFFLGIDSEGRGHFASWLPGLDEDLGEEFQTLRAIGSSLNALDMGAAVHALALSQWHQSHRICSRCGRESLSKLGGSVRECPACGASHHPRTDPAVIVLIRDQSDRILLGRQRIWPAKRFSAFAGFVEPGESFENAVHREIKEECGAEIVKMKYLGSQPWPFPASIMIAFDAEISNPESVVADGDEIEEIIWLDRESLRAKCGSGELLLPPVISVARAMIHHWYGPKADQELSGGESWRS